MNPLAYVCATLKGTPPHVFVEAWGDPDYGMSRMLIDLAVVGEINDQITEATEKARSKKGKKGSGNIRNKAKGAVARRNQRRENKGV